MAEKIYIGHARGDERGKYVGGKAGDQTGKEVCKSEFYWHSKGWIFLEPIDPDAAEKIASCSEDICDNPCVGYNQKDRLSLYNAVKDNGFKCDSKNLKMNVNCDCSSKVRVCVAYAGIELPDFSTANQKQVMLASGAFRIVEVTNISQLKRGMIVVTKIKGHTIVILTDGTNKTTTKTKGVKKATYAAAKYSKKLTGVYKSTANLNVRHGAGTDKAIMTTIPKGTKVQCYGYYSVAGSVKWYYVQFTSKGITYTGFCSSKYLAKN